MKYNLSRKFTRQLAGFKVDKESLPTIIFFASTLFFVSCLSIAWGMVAYRYHLFPYTALVTAYEMYDNYQATGSPFIPKAHVIEITPQDKAGVTLFDASKAMHGMNLASGTFDDGLKIKFIDMNGATINDWPIKWSAIWPYATHVPDDEIPKTDLNTSIHGVVLLEGGDVVFNFEYLGLVRLDKCGDIVWRVPRLTHHSLWIADDGNLWVPAQIHHSSPVKRALNIKPPFVEPTILEVSPNGEVLREISILDVLTKNDLFGLLYVHAQQEIQVESKGDIFHLNNVKLVPEALANADVPFRPGDIMVSLRNLNTLMIFDPQSLNIKWIRTGEFFRQHDPDFLPDGRISLFDNNNRKLEDGSSKSRILIFDFARNVWDIAYEGSAEAPFFTDRRGKHAWLENGNLLVTEAQSARAFEVTPDGEIVWEFINNIGGGIGGVLTQVDRYDEHYRDAFDAPNNCAAD